MSRSQEETRAIRAVVVGRVQGVWYRAHAERKARELQLVGYVRNLPDGTVEIVARGRTDQVQALLDWTWQGSPQSNVSAVDVEELGETTQYSRFETRY